ncbi:hypothetical protein [Mesorhizobium sp. CN2-181]|uniref:hypothetical protein n=1 Tax=Mesorhizobium yinganensis TaxID=3157707 RepID=UPI0032B72941
MRLTNEHGISLPLAVWLLHDEYDHINEPNYISATSLLKSTRQLVLQRRIIAEDREIDISSYLASRFGNAVHDSIDKAWTVSGNKAMKMLGYPEKIWSNIRVNPSQEQLAANPAIIPVWIEQRSFREVLIGSTVFKIGGKFDMVLDGRLFDTKTTSVYSYLLGRKDGDYAMQGGIYRWLNPELITSDHIYIQFLFTDWQRIRSKVDENYPKTKALEYPVELPSLDETENFIRNKLAEVQRYKDAPDEQIPYCTDKELWRGETVYKYYGNAAKTTGRSTRNFDDKSEAHAFMASKGGEGVVIAVPGEVKACEYCPAFSICRQKDQYFVDVN